MLHLLLAAAVASPIAVPEPLKSWVPWALQGHADIDCPLVFGAAGSEAQGADRQCLWPSRLSLRVDEREGHFTEEVTSALAKDDLAPLPGGDRHWPLDVTIDGRPALVVEGEAGPRVMVTHGSHTIAGHFQWDSPPESIKVPADLGLLDLVLAGKPVATPDWSAGELNLTRQGKPEEEENRLVAIVSRRLDDGVPFQVLTHIELSIAGKSRDELLGPALLPGTFPVSIDSRLPVRLEPDGRLRVQARQGTWTIDLVAYVNASVASLSLPPALESWPAEEVWVFQAEPALRDVELSGLPQVDPQQTRLPDDWKSLPAYRATPGATLALGERRRGDPNPPPDDLHLDRTLWLDFDGRGYTLHDRLYGQLHQSWRLDLAAPAELGHVHVGERDQLITRGPKGGAGFEVREGGLSAEADSRLAGEPAVLPAVGWDHDVKSLSATLNLPPGWRLFNALGVDHVDGGFVAQWTLLDLFLLLVISAAIGQLLGAEAGLLALCALGLTFHEPDAPQWLWLLLVALEGLRRVVKSGAVSRVIHVARLGAVALLAFALVQFAIGQLRSAFYPTLAPRTEASWSLSRSDEATAALAGKERFDVAPARYVQAPELADGAAMAKDALHAFGEGGGEGGPPPAEAAPRPPGGSHREMEAKAGKLSGRSVFAKKGYDSSEATAPNWTSEVDPAAIVQTGPGLPTWSWTSVRLSWSGPVPTGQGFRLWLIPPPVERALNVLRVALTLLLCFLILGLPLSRVLTWLRGRRAAFGAAALLACFAAAPAARADYPDPALLTQLGDRLAELPKCQPKCGAFNRLLLGATAGELRLGLSVSAAAPLALPLPQSPQWRAAQVTVDGRAAAVARRDDGQLWVAVATGVHQILEVGPLAGRDVVQLNLPLKPRFTSAQLGGWTLLGLHEDGDADDDLQLSRSAPETQSEKAGGQRPETLPPFALVERQLTLGLNWTVQTTVRRQGPQGPTASPVVLEVPLLPGESVISGDTRVTGSAGAGKAQVSLAPGQDSVSFSGKLPETKVLTLTAPKDVPWSEVWYVDVSPLWHLETKGIPEIHAQDAQGARRPEWHPWPGEQVTLDISRPAALPGQSVTIDQTSLSVTPGLRETEVELRYTARASRGDQQHLSLPAGAKVEALDVSGQSLPVPREGAALDVPLKPGQQQVHVRFTQNAGIEAAYRTPAVDLGTASVNADLTLQLPSDRWVLWLHGPAVGPAVLLWGELLALLIVAIVASRLRLVPLGIGGWFLLCVGFTQDETPLLVGAAVVGFLLILGVRRVHHPSRPILFNLTQILLAGLAVVAGFCLLFIVRNGLLTFPQMGIDGVGSSATSLHWFADRSTGPLAQAFVLSAPLWVYRLAMLGWSLWLALTCVRLAPWAFGAFSAGGIVKRKAPAPAPPAAAPGS